MAKKALVCYMSIHHGNTKKIAGVTAQAIGAECVTAPDLKAKNVADYDLIGFGSGIYFGKHHKSLLAAIGALPSLAGKNVFVFSTAGFPAARFLFHRAIRKAVEEKGAIVAGEFACKGWDSNKFFGICGGVNKEHPDERDLRRAKAFAEMIAGKQVL
jgi:flavodoxin